MRKFDPCFSPPLKVEALPNEKAYRDVRDLVGGNETRLRPTLEEIKAGRRVRLFNNYFSFVVFCEIFFSSCSLFLNKPGLSGTGIDPGMTFTSFPSSIGSYEFRTHDLMNVSLVR